MQYLRSRDLKRIWATLLIAAFFLCSPPAGAQLEPVVKSDWRFHAGDHWVGLVEYARYNTGKTYVQLPAGVRFLSPAGIRFTAVFLFVIPIFGIVVTVFGIRSAVQFFKKERISTDLFIP